MSAVPPIYRDWMTRAIESAALAVAHQDVPVAALLLDSAGELIAEARNEKELRRDPTAHAEVLALRAAAAARGDWHLEKTTLIVTLEPCAMCAGAILQARVPVVVFGAWDPKAGAAGSVYDLLRDRRLPHRVEVFGGVEEVAAARQLQEFFSSKRPQ